MHVGSRWYRAPEICLIENQYDQAQDIWSLGCVLYELIQYTLKDNQNFDYSVFTKVRYPFRGDSCFPLTPCPKLNNDNPDRGDKRPTVGRIDQVKVIL